jgi:uncharacterized lipoprotein YddW (UPF0748 family)
MSRKGVLGCAFLLLFALTASAQPRSEYRAFWVDTFNTPLNNHSNVQAVVDNALAANANAVFVQVRRRGDAFYLNALEPLPDFLPIEAGFDPLQDLIDTAHASGLEVHAFVIMAAIWHKNPTFAPTATLGPPLDPNHVFNLHGGYDPVTKTIVPGPDNWLTRSLIPTIAFQGHRFGNDFYLDFGHPDAAAYTVDVLMHLVRTYDIDGLHFDRIRYPDFTASGQTPANGTNIGYNVRSVERFDWVYDRGAGSPPPATGDPLWMQWRRDQVTNVVRRLYLNTMAEKPWVKISAATIVYGGGPTTEAAWNSAEAYWRVYQDWRAWTEEGILDIAAPMNYKREHTASNVPMYDTWNEWTKNHQYNRAALIGQAIYLNAIEGSLRQTRRALAPSATGQSVAGTIFYSMATSNAAVPANPFAQPAPANTPLRSFAEFASGYKTGASVDGGTLYEPAGMEPVFAEKASIPVLPWKNNPQVGHLRGFIRDTTGAVVDTGAVTITRVSGDDLAPGRRSVNTATDGGGFYGGVDLAVGRYQVSVTPVRHGAYLHQCTVEVTAGQVSTFDINADPDSPVITLSVSPGDLWPPDGALRAVTASISASDASPMSLRLTVTDEYGLVEVTPMTMGGGGQLTWTPSFEIEASRLGEDLDGRTYTVTLTATDAACNTATASATVRVAHDQREKN